MKRKAKNNRITKVDADVLDKLVRLQVFLQSTSNESKEVQVIVKELDAEASRNNNNQETL